MCAAEISGDARGARLASELRRLLPDLRVYGLGGARMRRAGVDVRIDITDRGTVGWFDHWRDLPRYLAALRFWRHEIRHHRPAAAMVIDAPGISFPFARVARAAGVPVVYFVAPQTWLWSPGRAVERLRAHADVVIPTLEAEAAIYERARLPVIYEGHPALDDLVETYGEPPSHRSSSPCSSRRFGEPGPPSQRSGLQSSSRCPGAPGPSPPFNVALVPGSRRHAIRRLLPVMLDALDIVKRRVRVGKAIVSVAAPALRAEVDACLRGRRNGEEVVEDGLSAVLSASDVVLASTGGNLLDATFAGVPAVACYRVDLLTYLAAKHLLHLDMRIPAYALPNLIAGDRIVPTLIQRDATPARLADAAVTLMTDERARASMCAGYGKVRAAMGTPGVNARIAGSLIRLVDLGCPAPPLRRP